MGKEGLCSLCGISFKNLNDHLKTVHEQKPCESMEEWEDDDNGEYSSVYFIDNVEQSSVDCSMDDVSEVRHNVNVEQSSVDP